jgi:trehalose-6-phosphate hydrolase
MRLYAWLIAFLILFTSFTTVGQSTQKTWWKESVFYEIYMPSYADSNGDGYGDFKGMTARLDHLQSLGVKGIWLTPFLLSPKVDNGYDVASYYDIDPAYGNIADFKNYVAEAHRRGIKVIMDMVLNHTSTESKWFKEASKGKENPYRDYYIWQDKPNNWESFFGGPAWQKDSLSGQYYYHKFDVKMADLNWSNPQVVKDIQEVLRYWLNLGVDGFRLDVINFLTTEKTFPDNPVKDGKQEHKYDVDQAGVKDAIKKIRAVVNEYKDRFMVGEIGSDKIDILKQYQSPELLDVVFNFNFGSIPAFSAKRIYDELQRMEAEMPGYPTLFFGSHDMPRLMDRLADNNPEKALALAALMLTAKGVPFIYYGEEIGMRNTIANSPEQIKDIQGRTFYKLAIDAGKTPADALKEGNDHNRDKSRSPMQWDSSAFAGFSQSNAWIPVNADFKTVNVANLEAQKNSLLDQYKKLLLLRNTEKALQYGTYKNLQFKNELISFDRIYKKRKNYRRYQFQQRHAKDTTGEEPADAFWK